MNPASDGIEVDDAAAYFGATQSSDVLHAMMAMPQEQAMVQFFELLSDIVLRPGDFDFEAASERMQCEGGEIYYLVAGHLGLMSMPDPLLQALGMPDSSGETAAASAAVSDGQRAALGTPRQSHANDEAVRSSLPNGREGRGSQLHQPPAINAQQHRRIHRSPGQHKQRTGRCSGRRWPRAAHSPPLASGAAAAATVDVPETTALPTPPAEAAPHVDADLEPARPLPTAAPTPAVHSEPTPSTVGPPPRRRGAPEFTPVSEVEQPINIESEKQVAKATQDAFSGAFSSELVPEPEAVNQVVHESNCIRRRCRVRERR